MFLGILAMNDLNDGKEYITYRVCVMGTSNAIFRDGYVQALRSHHAVSRFENYSLGGSSSNAFGFWKERINFSEFDFVILDYCVNDTTLFHSGIQNAHNIASALTDALITLLVQKVTPLILMLPLLWQENPIVPNIYRQIASKYGVEIFDGLEKVAGICSRQGCDRNSLFEDPYHLKRDISSLFACELLESAIGSASTRIQTRQIYVPHDKHLFLSSLQVFGDQFRYKERKTSLITAELADLRLGQVGDIHLNSDETLVGIVVDLANSKGVLTVWPLPEPVTAHNGIVRINILEDRNHDAGLQHKLSEALDQIPVMVALCGFMVSKLNTCSLLSIPRR
jgi:hypothetical protein